MVPPHARLQTAPEDEGSMKPTGPYHPGAGSEQDWWQRAALMSHLEQIRLATRPCRSNSQSIFSECSVPHTWTSWCMSNHDNLEREHPFQGLGTPWCSSRSAGDGIPGEEGQACYAQAASVEGSMDSVECSCPELRAESPY